MSDLRRDDAGLAEVVGAALLLALMTTALAVAVTTTLPRWGADAEHAWDRATADAVLDLSNGLAESTTNGAPVNGRLPSSVEPKALEIPLVGRAEAVRAEGWAGFEPSCGAFELSHTLEDGSVVADVEERASGCLVVRGVGTYTQGFLYQLEHGGVLRIDGGRAVVLRGPPVEAVANGTTAEFALTTVDARGAPSTGSVGDAGLTVDFARGPGTLDRPAGPNADRVDLALSTAYPEAWRDWYEERLSAGLDADDYDVACVPADCSLDTDGLGKVEVAVEGPEDDAADVRFTLAYAEYGVVVG